MNNEYQQSIENLISFDEYGKAIIEDEKLSQEIERFVDDEFERNNPDSLCLCVAGCEPDKGCPLLC